MTSSGKILVKNSRIFFKNSIFRHLKVQSMPHKCPKKSPGIPPTLKFQVGLNLQWTPWNNPFLAHIVFVKRIPVSFHSVLSLSLRWFSVHLILHDLFFLYSPNNLQDTFWGTVKHLEEGHIWDTVKHPEEGNFSDTVMHPDEGYLHCCWL